MLIKSLFCTIVEYGEGSFVSTLGDVYSLGILLLEMFTGRSPTADMFRGSLDLRKFSEDALPERIWEITDTTMWLDTDAYNRTTRSKVENCLVSVIALGYPAPVNNLERGHL
jgi:serine/threonine protein kinase